VNTLEILNNIDFFEEDTNNEDDRLPTLAAMSIAILRKGGVRVHVSLCTGFGG
jgi:hypothetical protein